MLEIPETISIAKQINSIFAKKTVEAVLPPIKEHKFCWFYGDVNNYSTKLKSAKVVNTLGQGIFVDIVFDNGQILSFNDGVNARFYQTDAELPNNYQLLIKFSDKTCLAFTVAMYGGIYLHDGNFDNEYYIKSKNAYLPGTKEFEASFWKQITEYKQTISAKAFLATEQHFPGICNGVIQDILFSAGISPRTKLSSLDENKRTLLLQSINTVIANMIKNGGRDTEKDLFGNKGLYKTIMSKESYKNPCPKCGGQIKKETYLGGSVYYCPQCQK